MKQITVILILLMCPIFHAQEYNLQQIRKIRLQSTAERSRVFITLTGKPERYSVKPTRQKNVYAIEIKNASLGSYTLDSLALQDTLIEKIESVQNRNFLTLNVFLKREPTKTNAFSINPPPSLIVDFTAPPAEVAEIKTDMFPPPAPIDEATTQPIQRGIRMLPPTKIATKRLMLPAKKIKKFDQEKLVDPELESQKEVQYRRVALSRDTIDFDNLGDYILKQVQIEYPNFGTIGQKFDDSRFKEVIIRTSRAIELENKSLPPAPCLAYMTEALVQREKYDGSDSVLQAIDMTRLLLRRHPESKIAPLSVVRLAQLYRQLNFNAEATAVMGWLDDFSPNEWEPQLYFEASLGLMEIEKFSEAREYLRQLLKKFPDLPDSKIARSHLARCHYALGNFPAAHSEFLQVYEMNPDVIEADPEVLKAWGFTAMEEAIGFQKNTGLEPWKIKTEGEEFRMAREAFQRFLFLYPEDEKSIPQVYDALAWCNKSQGLDADAVKYYQVVINKYPDSVQFDMARIGLAELGIKHLADNKQLKNVNQSAYLKPFEELRDIYDEAQDDDQSQIAGYMLGQALAERDDQAGALKFFAEMLRRYPETKVLGQIHDYVRRHISNAISVEYAKNNYQNVLDLLKEYPNLKEIVMRDPVQGYEVLDSYYQLGLYEKVVDWAARTSVKVHKNPEAQEYREGLYWRWADSLLQLDRRLLAKEKFEMLLKEYPDSMDAPGNLFALGRIAKKEDEIGSALEHFNASLKHSMINKEVSARVSIARGNIYFEKNEWKNAKLDYISAFRAYQSQDLDLRDQAAEKLLYKLAHARYRSEDYQSALMTLDEFINLYPESENRGMAQYQKAQCHIQLMLAEQGEREKHWDTAVAVLNGLKQSLDSENFLRNKVLSDLKGLEQRRNALEMR